MSNDFDEEMDFLEDMETEDAAEFDMPDDIVTLYNEAGEGVDFQLLDMIPYEDNVYAVLYPLEEDAQDGELVILKASDPEETEDEEVFEGIEDEAVINAVYNIFKEAHQGEFDFAD